MTTEKVADRIRCRRLISVAPDSSVDAVCRLMTDRGIGAVAVVRDCGALAGVVSERDIVSRVVATGRWPATTKVQEIMTREPCTIDSEQALSAAFDMLRRSGLRHLPVMRNGRPISMLSIRDIAAEEPAPRTRSSVSAVPR